ncbi:MAG TPA: hypothetical protein VMJ90_06410 [Anaerolineales bacterium]|nr:hypothetical protein [Anaerolineales bacterium]
MKTISIFLALVNAIFAGILIAHDLSTHGIHASILGWTLIKLSAGLLVIVIGASAWLGVMGSIPPGPVLLGNLFLVALGPATVVWTLHVALTTGDVEYDIAVYGGSLLIQGLASLLGFAGESRSMTTS